MPRFAANLSLMYTEFAFADRFAAAAADGFGAIEYQFPYAHPRTEFAARVVDAGLHAVLINAPPGDHGAGDRGLACLSARQSEFRRGFLEQALPYALALKCPQVHVMAGVLPAGVERAAVRDVYIGNLAWAAREAASVGVDVLIEPLNTRDVPGYFLNRQDEAHAVLDAVDAPNLKVQMDLYHCQIVEGDLATKLRRYLPTGRVGHLQIAGVPDRHEPDRSELDCAFLLALIDATGWAGHVGCEYRPRGRTLAGLGWMAPWRR